MPLHLRPAIAVTSASEHCQFEQFEVAVDVLETQIAQPPALRLDRSQDVLLLVGAVHVFVCPRRRGGRRPGWR